MPQHGFTDQGTPVHGRTADHHRTDTRYQRFNKRFAIWLTTNVGSMTCYWVFTVVSLVSLPAVVAGVFALDGQLPSWLIAPGLIALVAWMSSNYLQLTLLPAIIVGQNLQAEASDARAARTFQDTEQILDLMDADTDGGITVILERLDELERDYWRR